MDRYKPIIAALALGLALGATAPAEAQDAAAGETVFASQCGICHSVQAGRNMIGPSLSKIVGRRAGQEPNFHYSPANKASGEVWDAATLENYLTSPGKVVPDTTMAYPGLKDAQKRADLIAYLATVQ